MKKIIALTMACSVLSGCHYLGEPEAYTVVDEETAVIEQQPVQTVQPIVAPVMTPAYGCGCGAARGVRMGACQMNPGVTGPLVIRIPEQSICIK